MKKELLVFAALEAAHRLVAEYAPHLGTPGSEDDCSDAIADIILDVLSEVIPAEEPCT
jgi:hypothetical protein